MTFVAELSGPPSANRIWRVRNGFVVKSAAYTRWKRAALTELRIQHVGGFPRFGDAAVHVSIKSDRPHARRDLDNQIKPLLDLLQAFGVYKDDRQVDALDVRWSGQKGDRVRIEVSAAQGTLDLAETMKAVA